MISLQPQPVSQKANDKSESFFEKRFGLFIHWGLYSINAWHEQEQFRRRISRREYSRLIDEFNPVKFDPDQWLDIAENAGMKYICFTAKHIDGFCMWDTRQTEYNITNTPYRKDILKMLSDACHRRNFPLCIYYSAPDMNCKYYPNQGRSYELPGPEAGDEPNVEKYMEFVKAQVRELCTNYGKISGFWWDANEQTINVRDESVNRLIRSLMPGIIINDRGFDKGDFSTPERDFDDVRLNMAQVYTKPTEACESIGSESWGFRFSEDYFTVGVITRNITKHMAKKGNYLLNVGPRADGTFPDEAIKILEGVGQWYNRVKEAFEQVEPLPLVIDNGNILLGRKDNSLYVYLLQAPRKTGIALKPLTVKPQKATLLNSGEEFKTGVELMPSLHEDRKAWLHVWNIPADRLANEAVILKLEFNKLSLDDITKGHAKL